MLDFQNLFETQIMFFALIAIGVFLYKCNLITTTGRKCLTGLLVNVVLPCNIIHSFLIEMNSEIMQSGLLILLVSFGIQFFCFPLGFILYRKFAPEQKKVLRYATICSNAGFIGNPLVEGIYGSDGLLLASIYLIPQRIFMWSAGVSCFTKAKGRDVVKKVLTHPCIIAVFAGLLIMIFQIPLPNTAIRTINTLSSCTTALSMLVIGGILAEIDFKSVFSIQTCYFCFIRLILLPALVLSCCFLFSLPPLMSAVATVLSGMPAGTTTAILASQYHCDEHFSVKCIFLSTILSLITIPVFCIILEYLFV